MPSDQTGIVLRPAHARRVTGLARLLTELREHLLPLLDPAAALETR